MYLASTGSFGFFAIRGNALGSLGLLCVCGNLEHSLRNTHPGTLTPEHSPRNTHPGTLTPDQIGLSWKFHIHTTINVLSCTVPSPSVVDTYHLTLQQDGCSGMACGSEVESVFGNRHLPSRSLLIISRETQISHPTIFCSTALQAHAAM
jgi:hypothetical protein